MPWVRTGDAAATYPALMQVAADPSADERTVNEVAGWLWRCASLSGAHMTDYVVDYGTASMLGGTRTGDLIRLCVGAGLMTEMTTAKGHRAFLIVQDEEFIHIRLREEIEWERQQRNDTRNPALTVPVRRRDGDNCRWCGVLVQWRGKKTNRTGTIDHLKPGEAATVDTFVVACMGCNGGRGGNLELWDDNHDLRPTPPHPNYGKWTAKFLTDNGHPTEANVRSDDAAPHQAAADPAPHQGVRPAAPVPAARPAPTTPKSAPNSTPRVDGTSNAGTGRESLGSGNNPPTHEHSTTSRTAHSPTQPQDTQPRTRRRRGRRGGRPRHQGGTDD
ncbi:MAG: hypothetical protein FWF90_11465 [Promicromonosporaceae bacterium]|nr:hypothetical protein [Promicromonosporaceae bacterium]